MLIGDDRISACELRMAQARHGGTWNKSPLQESSPDLTGWERPHSVYTQSFVTTQSQGESQHEKLKEHSLSPLNTDNDGCGAALLGRE